MALPPNLTKTSYPSPTATSRSVAANVNEFVREEAAGTSIEYALLGSLIAVTIAGICGAMFSKLSTEYTEIANIFS